MDPNAQNPQGESEGVKKLEKDLQDLSQQAVAQRPPAAQAPTVQQNPQVPETPVAPPSALPVETNTPTPVQESPKKGSPLMIIAIILAFVAVLAVVVYVFSAKLFAPQPTPTPVAVVTPSPTPDVTANWKTYTDEKYGYSFKYPIRYNLVKPTLEAQPEGEIIFNAGSKEDLFMIDATSFSVTLDQFIKKYAVYDSGAKIIETNLNVNTPLGDIVNQDSIANSARLYKYVNHYDQSVNPGAKDIISYTAFFVSNNFGYILRSSNVSDNLIEFNQILSTFNFVAATPSGSPTASPTSSPSATPIVH